MTSQANLTGPLLDLASRMAATTCLHSARLGGFILDSVDPILSDWEQFARQIWPSTPTDLKNLRDDAEEILRAIALDMASEQSAFRQSEKSKGEGEGSESSIRVNRASDRHVEERIESGFDLLLVIAEYRALRASVVRRWGECHDEVDATQMADMIRFNESIDQLLTESVRCYTERVEQSRDIFLGVMGHDLRNPLVAITMLAELLLQAERPTDVAGVAAKIAASATAMRQMIGDILDFTRSRLGGEMAIFPARMDLASLGGEVLDEMRAAHPTRAFRFECHGDLSGTWDAARLRQVLTNLLVNAVQHGSVASPVGLMLSGDESEVRMDVRNEGPPLPECLREVIFEPLIHKPAQWHSGPRDSIGLGLFIVREIALRHGGSAEARSFDRETVFTVHLPRKP